MPPTTGTTGRYRSGASILFCSPFCSSWPSRTGERGPHRCRDTGRDDHGRNRRKNAHRQAGRHFPAGAAHEQPLQRRILVERRLKSAPIARPPRLRTPQARRVRAFLWAALTPHSSTLHHTLHHANRFAPLCAQVNAAQQAAPARTVMQKALSPVVGAWLNLGRRAAWSGYSGPHETGASTAGAISSRLTRASGQRRRPPAPQAVRQAWAPSPRAVQAPGRAAGPPKPRTRPPAGRSAWRFGVPARP